MADVGCWCGFPRGVSRIRNPKSEMRSPQPIGPVRCTTSFCRSPACAGPTLPRGCRPGCVTGGGGGLSWHRPKVVTPASPTFPLVSKTRPVRCSGHRRHRLRVNGKLPGSGPPLRHRGRASRIAGGGADRCTASTRPSSWTTPTTAGRTSQIAGECRASRRPPSRVPPPAPLMAVGSVCDVSARVDLGTRPFCIAGVRLRPIWAGTAHASPYRWWMFRWGLRWRLPSRSRQRLRRLRVSCRNCLCSSGQPSAGTAKDPTAAIWVMHRVAPQTAVGWALLPRSQPHS